MTIARRHLISVADTPYYHVTGRCVRRAFLCGADPVSGRDYEHRRSWVVERLEELTRIFAIEISAYAVMHNHYHLVVRLTPERVKQWNDEEVLERWSRLYGISDPIRIGTAPEADTHQRKLAEDLIEIRRQRLGDLSWFMKCLNEHIARMANLEDRCTGAFWEGRFKSQALLDERALLTCMAYVDLNPIRAQIARCLESSDYTSVQQRIREIKGSSSQLVLQRFRDESGDPQTALPYYLRHYLELVDWTGRAMVPGKRGAISSDAKPILTALGFDESEWLAGVEVFGRPMFPVVGSADRVETMAKRQGRRWFRGTRICRAVFGPG